MRLFSRTCLAVVTLSYALAAHVAAGPIGGVDIPRTALNHPDLVVTQIQVGRPPTDAGFLALNVWVKVKNQGQISSPRSTVDLHVYALTRVSQIPPVWVSQTVPSLAVGAAEWVVMPLVRTAATEGILAAIVDPPTVENPGGQINETSAPNPTVALPREANNLFATLFQLNPERSIVYDNGAVR
jgi:hypothetical protein